MSENTNLPKMLFLSYLSINKNDKKVNSQPLDKKVIKDLKLNDINYKFTINSKICWKKCLIDEKIDEKLMNHFNKLNSNNKKNLTFNLIEEMYNNNVEDIDKCYENCVFKYKLSYAIIEENFIS